MNTTDCNSYPLGQVRGMLVFFALCASIEMLQLHVVTLLLQQMVLPQLSWVSALHSAQLECSMHVV